MNDDIQYLDLTDEEGNTETFGLVGVLEYEDDTYLVLEPPEDEDTDDEDLSLVFMTVVRDENGEDCYEPVMDEDLEQTLFDLYMSQLEEDLEQEEEDLEILGEEDETEEGGDGD